jgi:CheY-like chemotaxis protein
MKTSAKQILVIDDDPGMIKLLEKWLKVAGKKVIGALSGKSGLKRAKEDRFDLILIDIMLPDMGGIEVAQKLKADSSTADIPLIFISAYIGLDKGNEKIDIDGHLCSVFAKPLHNPKLLSEIRRCINRRVHGNKPVKGKS